MIYPSRDKEIIARIRQLSKPLEPQPTGTNEKLARLHGVKAVIFDIYGTLFISGSGDLSLAKQSETGSAIREAFQTMGIPVRKDLESVVLSELFFTNIEKSRNNLIAAGIDYPDIDIRDIWLLAWERFFIDGFVPQKPRVEDIPVLSNEYECRVNPTWPMPGIVELLDTLNGKGIILGIVSNAQFFTPLLFDAHMYRNMDDFGFSESLCFFSFNQKVAKPSPVFFERCARALYNVYSILPEEALYVGNDMLNDIWPSRKLGFKTALYAGDKRSLRWRKENPYLKDVEPDIVINRLLQLLELI